MSRRRRVLIVAGIIALAALLAFPLRNAVYETVIVPVAYLLWALGLLYHAVPQVLWWFIVGLVILYMFVTSLFTNVSLSRKREEFSTPPKGQVEQLAEWLHKSERGVYNRWLVANRLGKLAYHILVQRDSGRQRSFFDPLEGPDWNASSKLTGYLQAGLQGSFADYPAPNNPFVPRAKTPLDHEVSDAVEFLESKLDNSIR